MKYLSYRLSAAMWSRVLLLWLILAIGALGVGVVSLVLGQFIQGNIRDELESQQITFSAEDQLSETEREIDGVIENAGKPLTTGNQARIYSDYIGLHLREAAERGGYPGATYATLGGVQRDLRAAVAAAREAGDDAALEEAQAELDAVTNLRNMLMTGNTLRGNLFSAYGWDNVATGIRVTGIIIVLLSLVFFGLFFYEMRRGHLPPVEA